MNLKPLFDRVIVKEEEPKKETKGLLLPKSLQEQQQIGKIIAVGDGVSSDGKQIELQVKVGDVVIYPKFAGSEFKFNDQKLIVLKQTDILCKIEKEKKNG